MDKMIEYFQKRLEQAMDDIGKYGLREQKGAISFTRFSCYREIVTRLKWARSHPRASSGKKMQLYRVWVSHPENYDVCAYVLANSADKALEKLRNRLKSELNNQSPPDEEKFVYRSVELIGSELGDNRVSILIT